MLETNKELVRRFFDDVFNSQNLAACDEIAAEDYAEYAVAPFAQSAPGQVNGPQNLRGNAQWLLAQFPDLHMRVEAIVAEGDTVACRVFSEGTNLGKFNGVLPPTGKHFASHQTHWFRVADGKLAAHWATREDLPAMLQLGIIQPPQARK